MQIYACNSILAAIFFPPFGWARNNVRFLLGIATCVYKFQNRLKHIYRSMKDSVTSYLCDMKCLSS